MSAPVTKECGACFGRRAWRTGDGECVTCPTCDGSGIVPVVSAPTETETEELQEDDYGNTEADFFFCSFPDCGCDGARLCMAPSGASDAALGGNVEGMWNSNTPESKRGIANLLGLLIERKGRES